MSSTVVFVLIVLIACVSLSRSVEMQDRRQFTLTPLPTTQTFKLVDILGTTRSPAVNSSIDVNAQRVIEEAKENSRRLQEQVRQNVQQAQDRAREQLERLRAQTNTGLIGTTTRLPSTSFIDRLNANRLGVATTGLPKTQFAVTPSSYSAAGQSAQQLQNQAQENVRRLQEQARQNADRLRAQLQQTAPKLA